MIAFTEAPSKPFNMAGDEVVKPLSLSAAVAAAAAARTIANAHAVTVRTLMSLSLRQGCPAVILDPLVRGSNPAGLEGGEHEVEERGRIAANTRLCGRSSLEP